MLRTSLVLLSVALGLLAFIVFFERGSLTTSEREGRKGRVLASFVRDRVTRVELQRKGVTTVLDRVAADPNDPLDVGGWRVAQPYRAKADHNVVDSLLGALEWVDARRSVGDASATELEQFGLKTPRYRLKFTAGRDESGFSLGSPAADGGGFYLQLRGQSAVYVVGKDLLEALEHEPADFHEKELHEGVSMYTLSRLSMRRAQGPELKIERRDGFEWLETPYVSLVGVPALTTLVDAVDSLRATRYVGEAAQPVQYGFEEPRFTLVLDSKVYDRKVKDRRIDERLELRIGSACAGHAGESYLRVSPTYERAVFCALDSELAKLEKTADELRETRLLPLEDSAIQSVQLRSGTRELSLKTTEKETRYSLSDHGHEEHNGVADPAALSDWYSALRALNIEHFGALDAATRSRLETSATVATFQRGKDAPYVVRIANSGTSTIASRLNEPALLELPAAARELLTPDAARFRKKRVLEEPELEFTKLSITRPNHSVESVTKSKAGFEVSDPVLAPAEPSTVDELLRLVSKLDVVRFVADRSLPEHGFAEPHLTLHFEYEAAGAGKRRVHTLVIAAVSGELGRYARLDADPAVFVVSNLLVHKLEEPLIARSTAMLPRARLAGLELIAGARRVQIAKDASGFTVVGVGSEGRERAERLVRTMNTLTAARALAYGEPAQGEFEHPALKVTARLTDPATEVTWLFVETPGSSDVVRVRRSDLPVTFAVPRAILDALLEREGQVRPG